ncbi:protein-tyrosine phosphatase-like protein [Scheffersomyces xylosifermentans]|uniref:protein-tyrosine phosphatase-like protein n=1 Tax=Scheffersomyces xylosifermentans TaxID=1304137 RepID=UPI00315CD65C
MRTTGFVESSRLPENVISVDLQSIPIDQFDLIFDTRPYNSFSKSHIKTSINTCIPTTLLKRSSLSLLELLNFINIPRESKELLTAAIASNGAMKKLQILFYDEASNSQKVSLNLFQTISKFNQFKESLSITYLDLGFQGIQCHPNCRQLVVNNLNDTTNIPDKPKADNSLACFKLPSSTNSALPYPYTSRTIDQMQLLPAWMGFVTQSAESLMSTLGTKFSRIEDEEVSRLKSLVSSTQGSPIVEVASKNTPSWEPIAYEVPQGIESGLKNRYPNIWPYEHSRVKLGNQQDDYFNANYIDCNLVMNCRSNYIATQNPLDLTIDEFWSVINDEKIQVIIDLDSSAPNYFKSEVVKSVEVVKETGAFAIKKINGSIYHFQTTIWPDFEVPTDLGSIVEMIELKNEICNQEGLSDRILVHCTAGCGRTGVFITVDSLINHFKLDRSGFLSNTEDLVYKMVQFQRTQRISMVQNLDQYIVCYEILLHYLDSVTTREQMKHVSDVSYF